MRFSDLRQVVPVLLERAWDLPQRVTREHEVKETYRKRAQEVGDFYSQQAYLIELRRFRQIQRERLEASKLLDQASKLDWSFAAPHRMPQELHPNELRDLAQAAPPRKSPGPDGLPSQLLRNLPSRRMRT